MSTTFMPGGTLCIRCEAAPRYGKNRYCLPCMKLVEEDRVAGGDEKHRQLLAATGKTFA